MSKSLCKQRVWRVHLSCKLSSSGVCACKGKAKKSLLLLFHVPAITSTVPDPWELSADTWQQAHLLWLQVPDPTGTGMAWLCGKLCALQLFRGYPFVILPALCSPFF